MSRNVLRIGNCIIAEKTPRQRVDWKPSRELMRLREIEKLIRARHGRMIPDPQDTDDRDTCLAYVRAAAFTLAQKDMAQWCARWAPWARLDEILAIEAAAQKRRRMMTADGAAGLLSLTWAERTKLGIKTIGASDMSKEQRAELSRERKRARDRARQEQRRRATGRKARQSQLGKSLADLKPWLTEGISRRMWFYRRARCTEVSRIEEETNGDTSVQWTPRNSVAQPSRPVSKPNADGVAGRREGPGDHPPAEFQEAEPHGSYDLLSEDAA